MGNNLIEYIVESQNKAGGMRVVEGGLFTVSLINDLPENINLDKVINYVVDHIPKKFMKFEQILIGDFPELTERQVNASYMDGAIYLVNTQKSEEDMIDDIIHEIAHAIEEYYGAEIYHDNSIGFEFLKKMGKVYEMISDSETLPDLPKDKFLSLDFNEERDEYLFKEVGYDRINRFTAGYFLNPYALTSLREYWATSFEYYFIGEPHSVKRVSPAVYKKIKILLEEGE